MFALSLFLFLSTAAPLYMPEWAGRWVSLMYNPMYTARASKIAWIEPEPVIHVRLVAVAVL